MNPGRTNTQQMLWSILSQIPALGWAVGAILGVMALGFGFRAWQQRAALTAAMDEFTRTLARAGRAAPEERRTGRPLEVVDQLRGAFAKASGAPSEWWQGVDDAVAPYRVARGTDGYFLTAPATDLLAEDRVIAGRYGTRLQAAVPGLLTSVGLLGTFLAILTGLGGLKPDAATETVRGVSQLVASMSGKFATSVVALFLSVGYVLYEHALLNGLRARRRAMAHALADTLPTLSLTHVLLDVRSESLRQSESLGNISSDMASAFAERFEQDLAPAMARDLSASVGATLGPALDTLGAAMDRVGTAVSALERDKQDSLVGEFRSLVASLEATLRTSLETMGQEFRAALTGSTRDEFTNVARALEGSAGVLQSMNAGFGAMQATLQGLIEESRRTTELQMAAGSERAESLNRLVEGLLVRLNESASQNATHVQGVLAQVVGDLSSRVAALSDELVAKVGAATAASQAAAADTVRQATENSTRTVEEVAELVAELRARAHDVDRAGAALREAQAFVQRTLEQSAAGLRAMHDAAAKVDALSGALAGTATAVTRTQEAQLRAAETARGQLVRLEDMSKQHDELLRRYDLALGHARELFAQLDDRLGSTLDLVLDKVQQYNGGVERNFQVIMGHVNDTMPRMGNLLHTATDELREQVEELTDVIEQMRGPTRRPANSANGAAAR